MTNPQHNFFRFLIAALMVQSCLGANWYVTPTANGSANGTDWSDSWCSTNIGWANISAGDTVWFAGGTYSYGDSSSLPVLTVSKSGTATSQILLTRPLTSDSTPTSAAGWNANYGTNVVMYGSGAAVLEWKLSGFVGSYVTLDGRTFSGTNAGWTFIANTNSLPDCVDIAVNGSSDQGGGVTNVTFANLEFVGLNYYLRPTDSGAGSAGATTAGEGIVAYPGYDSTRSVINLMFTNCAIHGFRQAFVENLDPKYVVRGVCFDHCYVWNNGAPVDSGGAEQHFEIFYLNSNGAYFCVRYCNIWDWTSEGDWDYATNRGPLYLYGTVFHDKGPNETSRDTAPFDDHTGSQTFPNSLDYIVNNTFYNAPYALFGKTNNFDISPSSVMENNLFISCTYEYKPTSPGTVSATPLGTWDYNYANTAILNPYSNGIDAHSINNSGTDPLLSPGVNGNFNIATNIGATYPRNAGIFVSNVTDSLLGTIDFSKDANGTSRAGLWSIGALEVTNNAVAAPVGVTITVGSITGKVTQP